MPSELKYAIKATTKASLKSPFLYEKSSGFQFGIEHFHISMETSREESIGNMKINTVYLSGSDNLSYHHIYIW